MLLPGSVGERIPKPKPTEIIRHEIVLGRSEREMLDGFLMAQNFNRVSTPIVAGLSDASFVLTVATLLAVFFPGIRDFLPDNPVDPKETLDGILNWLETEKEKVGDLVEGGKDTAQWWATLNPFNLPFRAGEWIVEEVS